MHNITERDAQVGLSQAWHGLTDVVDEIDVSDNVLTKWDVERKPLTYVDVDGNEQETGYGILVGSDDWLSDGYINSFIREAKVLSNKGINKFILIPKFYKSIGTNFLKIDFPIPFYFLNFIGIGRGIGWGVFNKEGGIPLFNESFEIASDYDYLLRCLKEKYYFKYVPCKYFHLKNGRSSKKWLVGLKEEREIALKYCDSYFLKILINLFFTLKFFCKVLNKSANVIIKNN